MNHPHSEGSRSSEIVTPASEFAAPVRVQRKRTKGWKMPPNTVYVGRPTKWGNPYAASHHDREHHPDVPIIYGTMLAVIETPADAVKHFREYAKQFSPERTREELGGKNLACWCALDQPCHADVLLEFANRGSPA